MSFSPQRQMRKEPNYLQRKVYPSQIVNPDLLIVFVPGYITKTLVPR